ncbi:DNA-protecting protein DprA [Treponema medium]|uniref:DNA protecting protein DprA n=2 Tax=Treponema medium TaxID=58231 RepID=A0AA87NLX9_TREMD|nr:DNA-processing protein DprA [Treponema medium]EPF28388.1 DNA protecting protein DprA [Treponema medium ATCC 700293]QSH97705.1 DNA-protecting protein DprA [Treponema medium]
MNTKTDSERRKLYIALSYCSFLKGSERLLLARTLDTLQALTVSSIDTLSRLIQRTLRTRSYKPEQLPQAVEKAESLMKYCRINITFYDDSDFPPLLREIPDAPFLLYYRGVLPKTDTPAAAIVGTRRPTGNGIKAALQLGTECGHAGIPVISGLARGIDTFAHRGALEGGGLTTAVLACGLDRLYPQSNARLAGRILETGGCILSEYAPGEPPLAYRFPQRNRIISGLARATVVVEAPVKSGALITADFALEQGRDVCVYGGLQDSVQNAGCKKLAEDGAIPVEHASDLLREWAHPTLQYLQREQQIQLPLFEKGAP